MDQLEYLLSPLKVKQLISNWLVEDLSNFDYCGLIVGNKPEVAHLICKEKCWLAGKPFFDEVFRQLECNCVWMAGEGDEIKEGSVICKVSGAARNILLGERVALNILSRASGVATITRRIKNQIKEWSGALAGTRKTTPGFRLVEKYSLLVGGASSHRYDLSSMIMIKDNHIWSLGGIKQAVEMARSVGGFTNKIEVECRTEGEAIEAAHANADIIMLDNFQCLNVHNVAAKVKAIRSDVIIEASGGISEDNVHQFCGPNIDVISMSKLTQGYPTIDFSLKIQK